MLRRPHSDFWQVGVIPASIGEIDARTLPALRSRVAWLPDAGAWRYLADPFGLLRNGVLHVFVEAYDYRDKRAVIERHELDAASLQWRSKHCVLDRPFHLSYPFVFEHEGVAYMVPESHQAGEIALYRGDASLNHWERQQALMEGVPGADASLIEVDGHWWMFYTLVGPQGRDQRELHVAHAPKLTGPWQPLAANPVRNDRSGARPAGRPWLDAQGRVLLPVQDSSSGYGSATRLLRMAELRPEGVRIEVLDWRLTGDLVSEDYQAGLHTVSACAGFTLVDVKRIERSRMRQWLDLKRRVRRLFRRSRPAASAA
jgi:hypothetical protein